MHQARRSLSFFRLLHVRHSATILSPESCPLRDRGITWSKVIPSELPQYEHICPRWNFTFSSSEHDSIVIVPSNSPFLYESYTLFSYTFHLYTSQHNGPFPGSHTNSKETPCTVPSLRTNFPIFLLCPLSNDIPV